MSSRTLAANWLLGVGAILLLYWLGNPFGVYDDIVVAAVLLGLTIRFARR